MNPSQSYILYFVNFLRFLNEDSHTGGPKSMGKG
jgi:hypothetical protein